MTIGFRSTLTVGDVFDLFNSQAEWIKNSGNPEDFAKIYIPSLAGYNALARIPDEVSDSFCDMFYNKAVGSEYAVDFSAGEYANYRINRFTSYQTYRKLKKIAKQSMKEDDTYMLSVWWVFYNLYRLSFGKCSKETTTWFNQ